MHRPTVVARIGMTPMHVTVTATEAERAAITARLGIVAVLGLECRFALRRREDRPDDKARGMVVGEGVLRATVVQDCVVTLDPFEETLTENFRVHFVRAGTEIEDIDPESDDELPYEGESIDLGEAAVEQLALVLDPYPRKPGAELPQGLGAGPASPFAALARRARDG
jgi:hypothetical protein